MSDSSDVCAVIVTYNCGPEILETVGRVEALVGHVVVIDNGSGTTCGEQLALLERRASDSLTIIRNDRNMGIATALNQGVERASAANYRWVLTLDQDSHVSPNMVSNLLAGHVRLADAETIAVLAPRSVDTMTNQAFPLAGERIILSTESGSESEASEVEFIHTSGNLIATDVFKRGFRFRDELFIDCIDIEFCLNLRRSGFRIVVIKSAIMSHTMGEMATAHVFGKSIRFATHSVDRHYYMVRNAIFVFRSTRNTTFLNLYARYLVRQCLLALLFERDRRHRALAVLQAVRDGLLHRLGPRRAARSSTVSRQRCRV